MEMEKRQGSFYANELNMDKVKQTIEFMASHLTLKECLKTIREISYDMISYYDENNKAHIYQDDTYSPLNREQACQLQRMLATACDLFGQSIIEHREFNESYLNKYINGGALELQVEELKEEIRKLKGEEEE